MEVAIKVNIDFEEVLFRHQPQPHLNESLEFLALWVDERALFTKKKYPDEYLEYLNQKSGHRPTFKREGSHIFWWGDLTHPELLKKIAHKSFCYHFFKETWGLEGICPKDWLEVERYLQKHEPCVMKGEGKMSGRGHKVLTRQDLAGLISKPFEPCVLEPLYDRIEDISALYVSDEKRFVFYKNQIDKKFQWRSNLIEGNLSVEENWKNDLTRLQVFISELGYMGPFSVDAFSYKLGNKTIFYPGSEVNPRKTMGWVNYKLRAKYKKLCSELGMEPKFISKEKWVALSHMKDVLILSPPENKFLIYWIGSDELEKIQNSKRLLLEQL